MSAAVETLWQCVTTPRTQSLIETLRDNPANLRRYSRFAHNDMSDAAIDARQQSFEDSEDR